MSDLNTCGAANHEIEPILGPRIWHRSGPLLEYLVLHLLPLSWETAALDNAMRRYISVRQLLFGSDRMLTLPVDSSHGICHLKARACPKSSLETDRQDPTCATRYFCGIHVSFG